MHNSSTADVYLTYIVNIPTSLHKNITSANQNKAGKKKKTTSRLPGSPLKPPLNTDHIVAEGTQYRSAEQIYQGRNAPQVGLMSRDEENYVVAMNSTHSSPTSCEAVLSKCDGAKVMAPFGSNDYPLDPKAFSFWQQHPSSSDNICVLFLRAL